MTLSSNKIKIPRIFHSGLALRDYAGGREETRDGRPFLPLLREWREILLLGGQLINLVRHLDRLAWGVWEFGRVGT